MYDDLSPEWIHDECFRFQRNIYRCDEDKKNHQQLVGEHLLKTGQFKSISPFYNLSTQHLLFLLFVVERF